MTTPTRPAGVMHTARRTALRTTLATALVAFTFPVFADNGGCTNKDCERTAGGLGRSVKAAPAPQPYPSSSSPGPSPRAPPR